MLISLEVFIYISFCLRIDNIQEKKRRSNVTLALNEWNTKSLKKKRIEKNTTHGRTDTHTTVRSSSQIKWFYKPTYKLIQGLGIIHRKKKSDHAAKLLIAFLIRVPTWHRSLLLSPTMHCEDVLPHDNAFRTSICHLQNTLLDY